MSREEDADRKRASNSPKTTALSVVWGSSGRLIVPRCVAGHLNSPSSVFVGCANKLHTAVILDCTNMNMYCRDMFLNTEIVYVQSFAWMFSLPVRSVETLQLWYLFTWLLTVVSTEVSPFTANWTSLQIFFLFWAPVAFLVSSPPLLYMSFSPNFSITSQGRCCTSA